MTELRHSSITGASTNKRNIDWNSLNWTKIKAFVFHMQCRIAKAEREGRLGKVKALQRILSTSFYAKCLAIKKVTDNKGGRTPGVDNACWSTKLQKEKAVSLLKRKGYRPEPLRRIYIDKKSGGQRPLSIPTLKDRAMQALWHMALVPVAEERADPNAYGFRPKRCVQDAIEGCFNSLCRKNSAQWILEIDIHKCFDRIDHSWLIKNVPMDKQILSKFLKAGFIDKGKLHPTDLGTPQGGIISPTLALMALSGLEKSVKLNGKRKKHKGKNVNVIFYADDGIISATSKEVLEGEIKPNLEAFLRERGLELSSRKTKVTHIKEGFDFLGFNIRKYLRKATKKEDVLLIKPSKGNTQSFIKSLKHMIKKGIALPTEKLIYALNPKITGWTNYYKGATSSRTFADIDNQLINALLCWGYKRHARKGKKWIVSKYFCQVKRNRWRFHCKTRDNEGQNKTLILRSAMDTKIWRHTKIKADATPFNPGFKEYFEKRRKDMQRWLKTLRKSGLAGLFS